MNAPLSSNQRFYNEGKDVLDRTSPCVVYAEAGFAKHAALIANLLNAHETTADSTLVLRVCTAYEQGYGQHGRALENPYTAGTRESEAWNMGWQIAKQKKAERLTLQVKTSTEHSETKKGRPE